MERQFWSVLDYPSSAILLNEQAIGWALDFSACHTLVNYSRQASLGQLT